MSEDSKPKRVLLIGHCGPDASYLRMAVRSALGEVEIISAAEMDDMTNALKAGVDLVLLNRELDYGFEPDSGVEMVQLLRKTYAKLPMIVVSNYPEVQTAAAAAGAMPGFGKREIGTPRVISLLRAATGIKT
jgi:ActR/RegA family two-component response regulator